MIEYIVIGLVLLAFEYVYIKSAKRLRIVDRPHHQSSHRGVVVRGGGVVFYMAFLVWSLVYRCPINGALVGMTILALVSFIDDIHSISPYIRLVCQFIAIFFLFLHSGLVDNALHVVIILAITCVGAINIYNFMDGINGLTGGYSLVVSLALLYVDVYQVHFIHPSMIVYIIISLLVFNLFNFRKRALCFAGDVGSLTMGFIIVYLILRLALKGQSMSWLAMLAVYLVDGGMTILHRLLLWENLMKPHKKHVYQIMANELKMSHLLVSGIYMALQAVCCVWYIAYPGYLSFFMQVCLLSLFYLLFIKKYYHLHVMNKCKE